MKVTESICNDGRIDSGSFWKLNKKMKGKKETPHAVLDLKGNKVQSVEEIKKAYEDFYEDLLSRTNRLADEQKDEAHVIEVNRKLSEMMEAAKTQEPADVNSEIVHRAILTLKKGKAKDRENWNNEIVIEGGDEMEKSVEKMAIEILKEEETPNQWNKMSINSIHKKGPKEKLPNKRGLFLTNIMSKLFEKILKSTMNVKNDRNQLGGEKERGTNDCMLLVMAVRDTNLRLRRDTYLFFGDLVKCFDRLWLRDCIVDLYEAGARARDAKMVYLLNKEAQIKIKTPVGTTEEIVVKEIVKQGTIFGPKLCCASTGKINQYSNTVTYISPETYINALTYIDDIASIGSWQAIVETIKGCSLMEQYKFMEFSLEKTKWMRMLLQYGSRVIEQIEESIGQGVVQPTDIYKYVGNWLNNKGNMDTQLEKMEVKAKNIIRESNNMCSAAKVGPMEMQAKVLVYEVLIAQSLFYNIEGWSNLRQADKDMLEVLQGKVLKGLIGLPKCTPYWGILIELNILPVHLMLLKRKLMLYHNLVHSDDERRAKIVILEQEREEMEECWFHNVKMESTTIGIDLTRRLVESKSKEQWKTFVNGKVEKEYEKMCEEKIRTMSKLRFLGNKARDTYIFNTFNTDFTEAMTIRLNMTEMISRNYGGEEHCYICNEQDSTEHILQCQEIGGAMDVNLLCE